MKKYMAIDQYGNTFHNLKHPQKDLMERLYCKHAQKMYVDDKERNTKNILIDYDWKENIFILEGE